MPKRRSDGGKRGVVLDEGAGKWSGNADANGWELNGKTNAGFEPDKTNGFSLTPTFVAVKKSKPKSDDVDSERTVSFIGLFRYATLWERFLTFLGIIAGVLAGFTLPMNIIIYGEFTTLLVERTTGADSTPTLVLEWFGGGKIIVNGTQEQLNEALYDDSAAFGLGCTLFSLFQFIVGAISVDLLNFSALRQISRIRGLLLQAVLRQDMEWYDTNTNNNFAVRITEDLDKLKEGIGEKIGIFTYLIMSFVLSIIVSFIYGWKLTLVVLSFAPIIIISTAVVAKVQSSLTTKELQAYSLAGNVAEEVLGSIRTVVAFGGENKEIERYSARLGPANKLCTKKGLYGGIGGAVMWFINYASYALGFWYGVTLILEEDDYTPAVLIIVFFGVLAGAQNMGLTSPHLEAFASARGSAASVFRILERVPKIDTLHGGGYKPISVIGDVEFRDVRFRYPSRPAVEVLRGVNLRIKSGETVALVGASGCGKSTLLQLLQRLYDPLGGGSVLLDGNDIRRLDVTWLRSQMAVVGQEPVLFATTVRENIRYGCLDASQEKIERAARQACAHDFIMKLPEGYDTVVGERGSQLSGGQKQRIAIARAMVRDPKILLLDEATSALDARAEATVQRALDAASQGRTTLVVSHRLATITNADRIVVVDKGQIVECGTHQELLDLKKMYYTLVSSDNAGKDTTAPVDPNASTGNISQMSTNQEEPFEDIPLGDPAPAQVLAEETAPDIKSIPFTRLLKLNSPEWPYIAGGCLGSLVVGGSLPIFAILFGEIYGVLALEDPDEIKAGTVKFSILFLVLGFITGLGTFVQTYMFNIAGIRMTTRIRSLCFSAMLRQEMGWFDDQKNSIGALCARLAGDASSVQGATGTRIGSILQAVSTLVIGFMIAMYYTWKMTLVSMVSVPLVLGGVFLEARIIGGSSLEEKQSLEGATKIAVEAIGNIRTVASLCQEKGVLARYTVEMDKVAKASRMRTRLRGLVFSLGQTAPFLGYSLSLFYGGSLVANEGLEYKNVIKVSEALIFGSWMLGQSLAFAPNVNAAKVSASRIFALCDRVSKVQTPAGIPDNNQKVAEGRVEYSGIGFHYPTRPDVRILRGLDLVIQPGKTVALVGYSGCGKSTCIQLLQRLYDPVQGRVTLDEENISQQISIRDLRAQLGIVSQEPVLFDRTIAENIAYGDNSREVPMDEIIAAAKKANVHGFVTGMPLGYETSLGTKGAQLSGGQKQRIAIARALVRNPRILLLDEATSALDANSEKIIQEALDEARCGRTCIVIAHRLDTIRTADVICVLDQGRVVETGTHEELLASGGVYTQLHGQQTGLA